MQFQLKSQQAFFLCVEIIKVMLKCIRKCKASGTSKTILRKNNIVGGATLPNFETYYKTSVIETL